VKPVVLILTIIATVVTGVYGERYALLAGNSDASGNYAVLKYVKNDIASLKGILSDFCGFPAGNIVTLYNGTPADLSTTLRSFSSRVKPSQGDLFLFYYSGHAEATCLKMGKSQYPLDSLKQDLAAIPSDIRIGIFDACQSGNFTRTKGGKLDEPFLFREDEKTKGQVLLSSSSINENAQESDALGGSVFTFYFVNALRGSADASGDGRVTLTEAYQYSYNRTIARTSGTPGGAQHPSYQFRIQGEGDIVLADLNVSTRGVVLGRDVQGAITVVNEQNSVMADLNKEKGGSVLIALAAGRYQVYALSENRRYRADIEVKARDIVHLTQKNFALAAADDAGRKKGADDTFIDVGFSCGFSCSSLRLYRLSEGLQERFGDYGYYSIAPRFSLPDLSYGVMVRIQGMLIDRYIAYISLTSMDFFLTEEYEGNRVNPVDDNEYAARLATECAIALRSVEFGIGYRCSGGYLNNFAFEAGIAVYHASTRVTSTFYDALYDVESTGEGSDQGYLVVPCLSVGYTLSITRWFDIGAKVRGRYQSSAQELKWSRDDAAPGTGTPWGNGDDVPLKYDFTGVDANLFVTVHLGL
jgi:hypothetical protein